MKRVTRTSLAAILAGAIGAPAGVPAPIPREVLPMTPATARLPIEGDFPSLAGATTWLNSPPLTPEGLRGKVVLADIWTYTCINWLRTLPYVRAWAAKYKDQRLVVIGVHSPEFEIEKDVDNIRRAVKDMGIVYPVAVDSNLAVWRAFHNEYWPALYLIDAKGHIRYHYFGEGEYEATERVIQQLLAEAGATGVDSALAKVEPRGPEVAADWSNLRSGENYVGYARTEGFASPGGAAQDKSHVYVSPARLRLNQWALTGNWTMGPQATVLNAPNGKITYVFHARDLHLVMGPVTKGKSARFRVLIDGHPPGPAHGTDVDEQGNGTVTEQRLHQLIRQPMGAGGRIEDHEFQIEFFDPGVQALAFTFG
jgi:thiol-disulfide isomerase/thioredoxin